MSFFTINLQCFEIIFFNFLTWTLWSLMVSCSSASYAGLSLRVDTVSSWRVFNWRDKDLDRSENFSHSCRISWLLWRRRSRSAETNVQLKDMGEQNGRERVYPCVLSVCVSVCVCVTCVSVCPASLWGEVQQRVWWCHRGRRWADSAGSTQTLQLLTVREDAAKPVRTPAWLTLMTSQSKMTEGVAWH